MKTVCRLSRLRQQPCDWSQAGSDEHGTTFTLNVSTQTKAEMEPVPCSSANVNLHKTANELIVSS